MAELPGGRHPASSAGHSRSERRRGAAFSLATFSRPRKRKWLGRHAADETGIPAIHAALRNSSASVARLAALGLTSQNLYCNPRNSRRICCPHALPVCATCLSTSPRR